MGKTKTVYGEFPLPYFPRFSYSYFHIPFTIYHIPYSAFPYEIFAFAARLSLSLSLFLVLLHGLTPLARVGRQLPDPEPQLEPRGDPEPGGAHGLSKLEISMQMLFMQINLRTHDRCFFFSLSSLLLRFPLLDPL